MKQFLYAVPSTLWLCLTAAANITHTYDAAGHLTKIDYGNGSVITYTYDNAGNLITRSVATTLMAQTIAFGALSNQPLGTAPFTISASASSGLVVSFASTTPAICTVPGSTVTILAAGTCYITASQAGNANYAAAVPVVRSFTVLVPIPNAVGLAKTAAITAITDAGLVVGTITTAASGTVPVGSVIGESPAAGFPNNAGSPVNLVISGQNRS